MILSLMMATLAATHRPPRRPDPDTAAWWQATRALAGDDMEGRDTGSAGHDRAARIVAAAFAQAGLKPAGDDRTFFQTIRLTDLTIDPAGSAIAVGGRPLRLLHDITLRPSPGMPTTIDATLVFRGYCAPAELGEVRGKVALCFGTHREGLPSAAARAAAVRAAGAAGLITIADPAFMVEPPRWPAAYARTVTFEGAAPPADDAMLVGTLAADALAGAIEGSGRDAATIVDAGGRGVALQGFDAPGRLVARLIVSHRALRSDNVLGLLPGTDPTLRREVVVLSAHLDGYGFGEPVDGDGLYNGALDDAAYVALLEQLAARRRGQGYRRSILFAAFTGEEKGLLGARWFVAHPTLPADDLVADVNLDQLRPIFPLDLLTVHALADSTLGDMARDAAGRDGIAVQVDPEPERGLLRRADHWPFIENGIPATGFVFGYRKGSASERIYRGWYEDRYHKPRDDLTQPIDWAAAGKFNRFFYRLVDIVANAEARPAWKPGSPFARPPAR